MLMKTSCSYDIIVLRSPLLRLEKPWETALLAATDPDAEVGTASERKSVRFDEK